MRPIPETEDSLPFPTERGRQRNFQIREHRFVVRHVRSCSRVHIPIVSSILNIEFLGRKTLRNKRYVPCAYLIRFAALLATVVTLLCLYRAPFISTIAFSVLPRCTFVRFVLGTCMIMETIGFCMSITTTLNTLFRILSLLE